MPTPATLLDHLLPDGPVPCAIVSKRMNGLGVAGGLQARARKRLGVDVVRDAAGTPHYTLPDTAQAA